MERIDPDERMTFAYLDKEEVPVLCGWFEWKEWWKREAVEGQLSNFNGAKSSATLRNQGSCTGIPCRGRRKGQVRTIRVSASVNAYGSFQALHCPTT